jgi:hypothetical protein
MRRGEWEQNEHGDSQGGEMTVSAFESKAIPPAEDTLRVTLGPAAALWDRVKAHVQAAHGPFAEEWYFAGKAHGWAFRLKDAKRAIVYMTPHRGHFVASFVLGEKACTAAREARLPAAVLQAIEDAPRYVEGRGIRVPVRTARDVRTVEALAALKTAR